jgi:hypothetical protein
VLEKIQYDKGYISSDTITHPTCQRLINKYNLNTINQGEVETIKLDLDMELNSIELIDNEKDYSKMTIKQLKELLSEKGINPSKMKKNEMIDLIEKSSTTINEQD